MLQRTLQKKNTTNWPLEFLEWGPHDLEGEIFTPYLSHMKDDETRFVRHATTFPERLPAKKLQVLRVVYSTQYAFGKFTVDFLFFLQDGEIVLMEVNPLGRDWKEPARQWVRQRMAR
jgi:hypothetical protein